MLSSLLLLTAPLLLGQVEATKEPEPTATEAKADSKEPWWLMRSLQSTCTGGWLSERRISISGWTDLSFTASSARNEQLPMGFNYRANEFLLQQNWMRIERSIVPEELSPTFGFRADMIMPGTDYRFTIARGLLDRQLTADNGAPNLYGFDPVQFYLEAYFPNVGKGLDLKVGRFFCQFGVEAIDAPSNALLSHAYTFIYNPFTHTGALATLKLDETWSVQAGMVLGSDIFIDPANQPTGIGSIKWAPKDGTDSVLFSFIVGPGRFDRPHNFHNPQIFDLVYVRKLNSRLTYSVEGLYGFTSNVPDIGAAQWFGILNYLTCEFTSKVSGTTRLEFFDDLQGQRTGFKGLYSAITAGLTFKLNRAVLIRPEVRWDYNNESRPFESRHGLFTASTDMILRW